MSFLTPRIPCQRDIEIYYAVNARHRRQVDVASEQHLSQSRVSRICAAVRHWISLGKPGECQPVETQVFLATDLWQHRLAYYEQQAAAAFQQTCEPPSGGKPAKPDPRLLKHAIDCARERHGDGASGRASSVAGRSALRRGDEGQSGEVHLLADAGFA
jgi:hypothetical protein